MMYPLVRELAVDGIPVAVTCGVLKIARQLNYRWLATPVIDAELTAAYRANASFDAHRDDPEFGYRFLLDEARDGGESMSERTAWKICSERGWWSAFGKRRGRNGNKAGPPVHEDLVRRDFTAAAPNTLWLADITEHWTREGKLYLCAVKDVYSNRIVGYSIDSRMKSRIAVAALDNAVAHRAAEGAVVAGCVLHTDRGSQGEFNWSSQHLVAEVFSGSSSAGSRSCVPSKVEVAGASEVPAACRGGVLGADRPGVAGRGGRRGDRRGAGGRCAVVPQRWRHGTVRHQAAAVGSLPLLRRA